MDFNVKDIAYFCKITEPCANTRFNIMSRYKNEIMNNEFYPLLAAKFNQFISTIPCPFCNDNYMDPKYGLCSDCLSNFALDNVAYI